MFARWVGSLAGTFLVALGYAFAQPGAGPWQGAEITAFTDFDDLEVKLDGKAHKAFLVGLRPIRETVQGNDQQDRLRRSVLAKLRKNALSARVITRRGEAVGLSIDTFSHHKNDFGHPWNPNEYIYCWSGWGGYNFNTYFLHTKVTGLQDNFGDNKGWSDKFADLVCRMRRADRAAALIPDLGNAKYAKRQAASNELKVLGEPALAALRKAALADDAETRRRAEQAMQVIAERAGQEGRKPQSWAASGK
jgi:hypothetical protein